MRFLCAFGKLDEARSHAEPLKKWHATVKCDAVKQAETLAWLGDDAGVLAVFERSRSLDGADGPEDDALLYHLAAVARFRQAGAQRPLSVRIGKTLQEVLPEERLLLTA